MSIIGEAIENDNIEDLEEELFEEAAEKIGAEPSARIGNILPDFSFLLSPTGPGSINDYIEHPFNSNNSKGAARIIRGFTGMLGEFDYAIVDIFMGSVEVIQESKKGKVKNDEASIPE